MKVIADFHIHSHYSRATSKQMNLEGISSGAKTKGLNLVGTGDFTFPFWLNELKKKLEPIEGAGLFKYSDVLFMLTTEVATYFTFKNEMKRVHHVIHAPSFEVVDQINEALSKYGNLASDGRPILNISAPRLVEILMEIDRDILIYPAHCLLPTTRILTNPQSKFINEIKNGDGVYTHLGRIRKITKILKREYSGMIYHIIPWYFSVGTKMTPEHPILIVKTFKKCRWTNGICKKTCSQLDSCKRKYFQHYKPCWIQAKNIEKGDALLYPRFKEVRDIKKLKLSKYFKKIPVNFPKQVNINKDFCRLIGYFVSEGYTFRDGIGFTFNEKEEKYVKDVKKLIFYIFCIKAKKGKTKGDLIFYSRTLAQLLKKLCYFNKPFNAHHKCLPNWMLKLPLKKQVEVLRGWWRGDKGSTSSPVLMNQMKIICLRLGIVPSIRIDSAELHKKRGRHFIKKRGIKAKFDNFIFDRLSFFEDKFNLLEERCFKKFKRKTKRQYGWIDENYVYLPIRIIKREYYNGPVFNLEVKEDNSYLTEFATVHNCWTPWMSCLGSKSGFDSIEECYQDQAKHVYALETGMSCYDGKTEVLTSNGWKKIFQVKKSDEICTLDPKTNEIKFQKPKEIFSYKYKGKMYRLKTKRVDLFVTPNHKLFVSKCDFRKQPKFFLKEAEFLFNRSKRFKKDGIWIGNNTNYFVLPSVKIKHGSRHYKGFRVKKEKKIPIKPWLKFFGFWLAEGWTTEGKNGDYGVYIANSNKSLISKMQQILKSFGYNPYRYTNKGIETLRIRDYQLFHYLKQFGKSSNRFVPQEIKSLQKGLLEIFFNYYIKGDGHIYGRTGKGLSATTSSTRLRDDLQEIALKIGISAYYKLHKKKGTLFPSPGYGYSRKYKQKEDTWVIYFIRKNIHTVLPSTIKKNKYIESWVDFNGKVFCVSVPNQVIYIRRNGIPVWCGNSDPAMNWRLSALDKLTLVSNSDSHSPWSWRLGREANVLELKDMSYWEIFNTIKNKDKEKILFTIETSPFYGKYHYTGHRTCNINLHPKDAIKLNNICPKCGRKLTIGVLQRVEELADRPEGFVPKNAIPFKTLLPLYEIISFAWGAGELYSKKVLQEHNKLIENFGNELNVLLNVPREELIKITNERIVEAIIKAREGKVKYIAGYDGMYGVPLFNERAAERKVSFQAQKSLKDF